MKLSLDSLNKEDTGSSLPIDSLKGQETLPLGNDLSNTNRAAFASMAVGGDVVSNYQLFKDSLDINADDQPVKQSLQKVEQARQQRILGISGEMLIDPSVPDGVKATIPSYLQQQETPDARKIVAEQALFEDNGREGANQEAARSWVFNDIDAAIQYKKDASKFVMAIAAKDDQSTWDAYKDMLAEIFPGARAMNVAAIREIVGSQLGGKDEKPQDTLLNIFTSFSNEREMREMIDKKPPQERMELLRKVVNVIQSQYGPGMFDNNEVAVVERARMLIADPEVPFSDMGKVGSVLTDTIFNAMSVIGVSPGWLKPAVAGAEKVAPKVVFKEPVVEAEQVATAAKSVVAEKAVKQEKLFDVAGTTMSESEIAQKRTELSALSESKFDRGTVKQLRSEQADLGNKVAQLEAEKLANKQNASQLAKDMKTSRKEALRKANKVVDEQIDEYKARISGVKSKLDYSERGYLAEAELSRFDQAVRTAKPVSTTKPDARSAVQQALEEAAAHNVIGAVKPSSVVSTLTETNPTKASAFVKAAIDDETGAFAKVVSGTSREELLVDSATMQPSATKHVRVKPVLDFDEKALDYAISDGGVRYTAKEMKSLKDNLVWSVSNAHGVKLASPMSQILEDSKTGFKIKATFIDGNTGFNDAQEAINRTMYALKGQGVGLDSLTVMKRTEKGYEPLEEGVDIASLPKGDYAVQVDHNWGLNLESGFEKMKAPTVKNALDRMMGWSKSGPVALRQGSITRHLWSPQTLFTKEFLIAPTVAADRAAGITKKLATLADEFNKPFSKLSKEEKSGLAEYIIKANVERIPFNAPEMIANGFTHAQVNVMSNWKRYWDTAYMLENLDKMRTLKLTGYKLFSHAQTGSELFVKPQAKNATIAGKVYDPDMDMILDLSASGKKSLYDNGGYVAVLRDHITDESGEVAKYVVVKNNVGSYAREFNESDRVLNYINGYYSVRHEAPLFVIQNVKDKSGRILYKRAVAEAGSIDDAEQIAKSLAARTEGSVYERSGHDTADFFVREDIKSSDSVAMGEHQLDVGISSGRSSQRFRGAPLESRDPLAGGQSSLVQSPLEAMSRTAYSLGNRIATRPYIESAKARWMEHYGKFVQADPTTHVKGFPTDPSQIGKNLTSSQEMTQAKTLWEYINSYEHGYESLVDVGTRSVIGIIADVVSKVPAGGVGKSVEGGLRSFSNTGKVTTMARTAVFNTMLVAQPVGMAVLQSIQSFANLSLNFLDYRLYRDLGAMHGVARGTALGEQHARGKALWEAWEATGKSASVDIHHAAFLGGGSGRELGGFKASKAARTVGAMHGFLQSFYNKGELLNQYTAWLVKRLDFEDVHKRPPTTQAELDTVHAESGFLTYQMNKAGTMPYNENTLNLQLQFFQIMHKAIIDPIFSRTLSFKDRLRLTIAPLLIFGIPQSTLDWIQGNVEKTGLARDVKDKMSRALEYNFMSKVLSAIDKDFETLDYAKYNPIDPIGLAGRLADLTSYPEMFTRNPTASLVDKGLTALVTTSRFAGITQAETGIQPNEEALWHSLGNMLAGTSQYMRGSVLLDSGVFRDKYGRATIGDINPVQAYAQKYFGITPKQVTQHYEFAGKSIELNKEFKDDLAKVIKNARQQLAMNGVLAESPEYAQQLMGAVVNVFNGSPVAMEELTKQLKMDLNVNRDAAYMISAMRASGYLTIDELKELVSTIPDEAQKKYMIEMIDRGLYGRE